ncbi:MAG: SPFH domain-containing protein [Candidatus Krumholzibacteriia bacterium]
MTDRKSFGEDPNVPEIRLPRISAGLIKLVVIGIIALVLIFTSFYTINPDEAGLVLRFGQYVRQSGPGLHLKFPFGVEQVYKVEVQRQQKAEFGFRTTSVAVRTQYATGGYTIGVGMRIRSSF